MGYIIVTRNPSNQKLIVISTSIDDDSPAEFGSEREAMEAACKHPLCNAWGEQVLEVE